MHRRNSSLPAPAPPSSSSSSQSPPHQATQYWPLQYRHPAPTPPPPLHQHQAPHHAFYRVPSPQSSAFVPPAMHLRASPFQQQQQQQQQHHHQHQQRLLHHQQQHYPPPPPPHQAHQQAQPTPPPLLEHTRSVPPLLRRNTEPALHRHQLQVPTPTLMYSARQQQQQQLQQQRHFGEKGVHFQKGRFTDEEKAVLRQAVLDYVAEHQLGDDGIRLLCSKKRRPELRGAWATIAQCLPHRSVSSCYHFCTRAFATRRTGKWTAREVLHLRHLVQTHGRKWTVIGSSLNRLPCSCRDKWRLVEKKQSTTDEEWSVDADERLVCMVMQHSEVLGDDAAAAAGSEAADTAASPFDHVWCVVAAAVPPHTSASCRRRWHRHWRPLLQAQFHSHDRFMLERIREMGEEAATHEGILWNRVGGRWPPSLYEWRWNLLQMQLSQDSAALSPAEVASRLLNVCPPPRSPMNDGVYDDDDDDDDENTFAEEDDELLLDDEMSAASGAGFMGPATSPSETMVPQDGQGGRPGRPEKMQSPGQRRNNPS